MTQQMKPLEMILRLLNELERLAVNAGGSEASAWIEPHEDHLHAVVAFHDALGARHTTVCGLGTDIVTGTATELDFAELLADIALNIPTLMTESLAEAAAKLGQVKPVSQDGKRQLPVIVPRDGGRGN